ncbi:MAG: hypothetical protein K2L12_06460 [Clostridia bacterium]|nr:hypothetical protein [Clostridia bacterium]
MEGNFYRLKNPRSARAEGHYAKVSFIFVFAVVFTSVFLGMLVYSLIAQLNFNIEGYIGVTVFVIVCSAFLGFGIHDQLKSSKQNKAERKLLNNCLCTDGKIDRCQCTTIERRHDDRITYYYEVLVYYSFYDDKNILRRCEFSHVYNYNPEFYEDQWLMIAFNDTDSAILGTFSFVKEDEEKFLKNEAERSADDFDELDNEPVEIDPTRKIQSAEFEYGWFWAAFGVFVLFAGYIIPISIFAVPSFISDITVLNIFIVCFFYFPCPFEIALIIFFIVKYVKKIKAFKSILQNEPNFVWGKIFASEKTYRSHVRKKVFYCYIDKDGNRHTKCFTGPAVLKAVQGYSVDVAIMYDEFGNSVPLYNYKFTDEE